MRKHLQRALVAASAAALIRGADYAGVVTAAAAGRCLRR